MSIRIGCDGCGCDLVEQGVALYGEAGQAAVPDLPKRLHWCARCTTVARLAILGVTLARLERSEDVCRRCGGPNDVVWCAPSPLWNAVMRGGTIGGDEQYEGIVCPRCFATLAETAGIARVWRLYAETVLVDLATTTPDGRVWDDKAWLWRDPCGCIDGTCARCLLDRPRQRTEPAGEPAQLCACVGLCINAAGACAATPPRRRDGAACA